MTQSASSPLGPGAVLGKYRIVQMLGSGGMGAVYSAIHGEIGKTVALKTLNAEAALDERAHARFLREAGAASKLDHPHVVNVMDYGTDTGVPFLVMEHLRGEDLGQHLGHASPMSVEATADIMLAVCAGVQAAHDAGIVHRDLKPGNIFLARTGTGETVPKVLDFGISKVRDDSTSTQLTNTGTVMGTTHYLSPEQVMARPVDGRSDQYAMGVIIYECVTGRRPHEGETIYLIMHSIGEGRFSPPRSVRKDLPPDFEGVILRAMARDAAARFASVHALGQALLPFASAKRQMMWGEYYAARAGGGRSVTLPLPHEPVALAPTRTADARPFGLPPSSEMPVEPVSVKSTAALDRPRRAVLPAAFAVLVMVGGGALWWMNRAREVTPASVTARSDEANVVSTRRAERRAAAEPAPLPASVRISVTGAPAGLIATVDGAPVTLPITWPRDGREREVRFEAPGYEPTSVAVAATEDRAIPLAMRALPPKAARTKAAERRTSRTRGRPRDKPAQIAAPPPSAITDI